jgi:hypothetical protein
MISIAIHSTIQSMIFIAILSTIQSMIFIAIKNAIEWRPDDAHCGEHRTGTTMAKFHSRAGAYPNSYVVPGCNPAPETRPTGRQYRGKLCVRVFATVDGLAVHLTTKHDMEPTEGVSRIGGHHRRIARAR